MSNLDQFFQASKPRQTTHPTLLWLDELLEEHPEERPQVQFDRAWDGFVFAQAWLTLVFPKVAGRDRRPPVREPWDKSYDDGLLVRSIQAQDSEQESARFALGMVKDFESIEIRVGKDYFSSLLVYCLRRTPLAALPPVRDALKQTRPIEPHLESQNSLDRLAETEGVLKARGQMLTNALKYPRDVAEEILGNAIARYLDERFHISLRAQLGMR